MVVIKNQDSRDAPNTVFYFDWEASCGRHYKLCTLRIALLIISALFQVFTVITVQSIWV